MSTGPTLTINRTTREVTLTRSPLTVQPLEWKLLTYDERRALSEAETPSGTNPLLTASAFSGFTHISVVAELPAEPDPTTLYLITE